MSFCNLFWIGGNSNIEFVGLYYFCGFFTFILLVGGVRMCIGITGKRNRAVEEIGKVNMSVGIIAYYQVMQVCQAEYFRQLLKPVT